jgi:hypothetical protein
MGSVVIVVTVALWCDKLYQQLQELRWNSSGSGGNESLSATQWSRGWLASTFVGSIAVDDYRHRFDDDGGLHGRVDRGRRGCGVHGCSPAVKEAS